MTAMTKTIKISDFSWVALSKFKISNHKKYKCLDDVIAALIKNGKLKELEEPETRD